MEHGRDLPDIDSGGGADPRPRAGDDLLESDPDGREAGRGRPSSSHLVSASATHSIIATSLGSIERSPGLSGRGTFLNAGARELRLDRPIIPTRGRTGIDRKS